MARAVAEVAQDEAERDAIIRTVWGEPPVRAFGIGALERALARSKGETRTLLRLVRAAYERLRRARPSEEALAAAHDDLWAQIQQARQRRPSPPHHHCARCGWAAVQGEPLRPCSAGTHAMLARICTAPAQQCARCGVVRCGADPRPPPMVGGLRVDAMLDKVREDHGWACCYCAEGAVDERIP